MAVQPLDWQPNRCVGPSGMTWAVVAADVAVDAG